MKKFIGIIVLLMFTAAIFGCSDQDTTAQQEVAPQEQQQHTQETAKAAESMQPQPAADVISGTVLHTNTGYTIFTDNGSYRVVGEDLSSVVGKNVRILGTIEESGAAKTINVESIVILE